MCWLHPSSCRIVIHGTFFFLAFLNFNLCNNHEMHLCVESYMEKNHPTIPSKKKLLYEIVAFCTVSCIPRCLNLFTGSKILTFVFIIYGCILVYYTSMLSLFYLLFLHSFPFSSSPLAAV